MVGETKAGSQLGHYQLRSLIGRGAMGDVFEAFDTVKQRTVALKVLPAALARDPEFANRFRQVAQSAAVLTEPHVIPIYDWGEIDGRLYIDMRLVQGPSLRALISGSGPMPPARAVLIVSQVAAALDAAHATGLMHRDVRPENVLITADGNDFAYLTDFGIAADAREGSLITRAMTVGSYAYMAPEGFGGGSVTDRADTYSMACTLHELLTGAKVFDFTTPNTAMHAHLEEPPPRPSTLVAGVPVGIDAVLARAMAKNPADRYSTTGEFARAAREAVTGADAVAASALTRRLTETVVLSAGTANPQAHAHSPLQPQWAPADAATPRARRSLAPIVLILMAIGVLVLGGIAAGLAVSGDDSNEKSDAPVAASPTPGTPSAVNPPPIPAVQPTPPTGVAPPLFSGAVGGADQQGFLATETARCNAADSAVAIGRTTNSLVVVCQVERTGRYYYKGMRISDGAAIELDDPVRTPSGFTVATSAGQTEYRIDPSALVIVSGSGQVAATQPMLEYAQR
ncbi:serine/threonine-protein kinase [Aldersonia kunmingensis]|uniref:serine/threonine-protein kinase n=1 Tax=Aldersonia kunmingensis TaxID=408066 RepID=UPI00082BC854|nr:serine/threonine-protein kinase [Aldersonia kunmingensis]